MHHTLNDHGEYGAFVKGQSLDTETLSRNGSNIHMGGFLDQWMTQMTLYAPSDRIFAFTRVKLPPATANTTPSLRAGPRL